MADCFLLLVTPFEKSSRQLHTHHPCLHGVLIMLIQNYLISYNQHHLEKVLAKWPFNQYQFTQVDFCLLV